MFLFGEGLKPLWGRKSFLFWENPIDRAGTFSCLDETHWALMYFQPKHIVDHQSRRLQLVALVKLNVADVFLNLTKLFLRLNLI